MLICPRCSSLFVRDVRCCGLDGERLVEMERDPLIGATLDRYRVVERIGEGGMAVVYRAEHAHLGHPVALKVLHGDAAADRQHAERFRREAKSAAQIRHPNVVEVHDFGVTPQGLVFMAMELLDGITLSERIERERRLEPAEVARIVRQTAQGLAAAHRLGFVHRDLKPKNLMLARDGRVVILDFGLVRALDADVRLTAHGQVYGTPAYMAPEQIVDGPLDARTDLYALGVITYELLAGQKPFGGALSDVLDQHAHTRAQPLDDASGLGALARSLMAKVPSERPARAEDVVAAIERMRFDRSASEISVPIAVAPRAPSLAVPAPVAAMPAPPSLAPPIAVPRPPSFTLPAVPPVMPARSVLPSSSLAASEDTSPVARRRRVAGGPSAVREAPSVREPERARAERSAAEWPGAELETQVALERPRFGRDPEDAHITLERPHFGVDAEDARPTITGAALTLARREAQAAVAPPPPTDARVTAERTYTARELAEARGTLDRSGARRGAFERPVRTPEEEQASVDAMLASARPTGPVLWLSAGLVVVAGMFAYPLLAMRSAPATAEALPAAAATVAEPADAAPATEGTQPGRAAARRAAAAGTPASAAARPSERRAGPSERTARGGLLPRLPRKATPLMGVASEDAEDPLEPADGPPARAADELPPAVAPKRAADTPELPPIIAPKRAEEAPARSEETPPIAPEAAAAPEAATPHAATPLAAPGAAPPLAAPEAASPVAAPDMPEAQLPALDPAEAARIEAEVRAAAEATATSTTTR